MALSPLVSFEAAIIVLGVVSLLSVVTLQQDLAGGAGTDDGSLVAIGHSLVASRDWTFTLGPGLTRGVNALLLGYLMYRSGLVSCGSCRLASDWSSKASSPPPSQLGR